MRFVLAIAVWVSFSTTSFADVNLIEKNETGLKIGQKKEGELWEEGEEMCVVRDGEKIGCGPVKDSTMESAQIELGENTVEEVKPGDHVQTYRELESRGENFMVSAGMEAGVGYYYPTLGAEIKIADQWYVGVMGSYSTSTDAGFDITSKGFLVSVNHYALMSPFKGFWFRAGAGFYSLDVTNGVRRESVTVPMLLSTVGWRGYLVKPLSLGIGVGLQYLPNQIQATLLKLRDVAPVATIDLGIRF